MGLTKKRLKDLSQRAAFGGSVSTNDIVGACDSALLEIERLEAQTQTLTAELSEMRAHANILDRFDDIRRKFEDLRARKEGGE